jgi:hypothetical protein
LKPAKTQPQPQSPTQQKEMSRDQKKATHLAIKKERDQFETQVRSFLSPDQIIKFEAMKKEKQEKRAEKLNER